MQSKEELNSNKVLTEMLETEQKYYESLQLVIAQLEVKTPNPDSLFGKAQAFRRKEATIIINKLREAFIGLKNISESLLSNAAISINEELSIDHRINLRKECIALFKIFFATLGTYTNLYSDYVSMVSKHPQWFEEINSRAIFQQGLSLQSYLIMPIQRGPRYLLLLDALIKDGKNIDPETSAVLAQYRNTIEISINAANAATGIIGPDKMVNNNNNNASDHNDDVPSKSNPML